MQGPWKRGRIAAAAACLGFLGVLGLAAVFRNEIETWYHLERLEHDPDHFLEIAGERVGSPERAACERFMTREEGKLALLRELAVLSKRLSIQGRTDYFLELDSRESTVIAHFWPQGSDKGWVTDIHEAFGKRPELILGWLSALGLGEHRLPEDTATTYEILNAQEGRIRIHVRKHAINALTPPPGPPASTPPSPPSTGTSAG